MIVSINLLLQLISSAIQWFFTINFEGIYIGWIFIAVIVISLIIKFFLQNRGGSA